MRLAAANIVSVLFSLLLQQFSCFSFKKKVMLFNDTDLNFIFRAFNFKYNYYVILAANTINTTSFILSCTPP